MAKQTVTTLIDDIDGSEASETVTFSYRGTDYTIDLNAKNAAALDKAIRKYVDNATRDASRQISARSGTTPNGAKKRNDLADVRAWAKDNGYEVSDRGRVAVDILETYDRR